MDIYKEKSFSIKPVTLLLIISGIIIALLSYSYLANLSEFKEIRSENKLLQKKKDSLLESLKISQKKIERDSLLIINMDIKIQEKDSLALVYEKSEQYYKNQAYKNYVRYKKMEDTYLSSDIATKRAILSELTKD